MTIRSILVAFNGTPASVSAQRLALGFAAADGAQVTGVLAHGATRGHAQIAPWLTGELQRMIAAQEAEACAGVEAAFREGVPEALRGKVAFLDVAGDPTLTIIDLARTYDLVAMGRFDPTAGAEHFAPSPDVVALQSGRPVMVVPPGHGPTPPFRRAVIAWDGKRAAARAMADAFTLLPADAVVTIVSIGDDEAAYRRAHSDPVEHARRHGLDAAFRLVAPGRRPIGEALLAVCAETEADLLVMGAYEHSKFSEDLIGGVTARVLRTAPLPVMLAH
jgi:nucleotide-binding universal stress UspA family protein